MFRVFFFLILCQFVLSDNILIAPLLKDDLYGVTTELHPEVNTQVWFKSIYVYAILRSVVVTSLTKNSTFNICVYSSQPPILALKCIQ